jgi:outer membrane protein
MMTWRILSMALAFSLRVAADDVPVDPAPIPGTVLTWQDCVRLAVKENPDLQASREAVINSDAVRMGAYSALYPQISASFTDVRSYAGANLYSPYVYSTAYGEQLTVSQLIFDGFRTKGNIDAARAQLNLAFANLNDQKATVSFNLKTAFAQLLYAQKLIKINHDVIDLRQSNERLVRLLYEGGSEDRGNMQLSQANLDQALYDYDQSMRTRDLSVVQLSVYVGRDLKAPVLAEGELVTDVLPVLPAFGKLAVLTPAYYQRKAGIRRSTPRPPRTGAIRNSPSRTTAGPPGSASPIRSSRAVRPTST